MHPLILTLMLLFHKNSPEEEARESLISPSACVVEIHTKETRAENAFKPSPSSHDIRGQA